MAGVERAGLRVVLEGAGEVALGLARRRIGDEPGAVADFTRALALAPVGWPGREYIERNLSR